jgi:hypothetical protein
MAELAAVQAVSAPMREFLQWVAFRPRTHAEAMAAWASHCPRFTEWEDALEAGFVVLHRTDVYLTPTGRAALADGRFGHAS